MKRLTSCFLLLGLAVAMLPPSAATAAPTIETQAEEAFLIDAETGAVLLDKNADQPMPPSSMSTLLTAYIVFDRLQEQRPSLEDKFTVSEKAWRMGGSKMFVELGRDRNSTRLTSSHYWAHHLTSSPLNKN